MKNLSKMVIKRAIFCKPLLISSILVGLVSTVTFAGSGGSYHPAYPGHGVSNTFKVVNTNDSGPGSLRQALESANSSPGKDRIKFKIRNNHSNNCEYVDAHGNYVCTIQLLSNLPLITETVVMDGSIKETRKLPGHPSKRPGIEILGVEDPDENGARGLTLAFEASSGSTIRGLIINNLAPRTNSDDPSKIAGDGVVIFVSHHNTIAGNYFGTDKNGNLNRDDQGNILQSVDGGVDVNDGSYNIIGGNHANDRNIIQVNRDNNPGFRVGILIGAFEAQEGLPSEAIGNVVKGNYVGLNAAGKSPANLNFLERAVGIDLEAVGGFGFSTCIPGCVVADTVIKNNRTANMLAGISMFTLDFIGGLEVVIRNSTIKNNVIYSNSRSGFSITGEAMDSVISGNIVYDNGFGVGSDAFNDGSGLTLRPPVGCCGDEGQMPTGLVIKNNVFGENEKGKPAGNRNGLQMFRGDNILVYDNVIKNNRDSAISLELAADFPLPAVQGITIQRNIIYNNQRAGSLLPDILPGIELFSGENGDVGGVTANDLMDPDLGVNRLQNFPLLTRAVKVSHRHHRYLKVEGSLNSVPDTSFVIEFFANSKAKKIEAVVNEGESPKTVLISEGEKPIGTKVVTTDSYGNVDFEALVSGYHLPKCKKGKSCITATATRMDDGSYKLSDTSEFSPAVVVSH